MPLGTKLSCKGTINKESVIHTPRTIHSSMGKEGHQIISVKFPRIPGKKAKEKKKILQHETNASQAEQAFHATLCATPSTDSKTNYDHLQLMRSSPFSDSLFLCLCRCRKLMEYWIPYNSHLIPQLQKEEDSVILTCNQHSSITWVFYLRRNFTLSSLY